MHRCGTTLAAAVTAMLLAGCETTGPMDSAGTAAAERTRVADAAASPPAPRTAAALAPAPASMPDGISYAGGDGSSVDNAVIVNGTTTDRATTRAEYAWLRNRYPGFRRREQALVRAKGRYYDAVSFDTADGMATTVYFDSTATFGKR